MGAAGGAISPSRGGAASQSIGHDGCAQRAAPAPSGRPAGTQSAPLRRHPNRRETSVPSPDPRDLESQRVADNVASQLRQVGVDVRDGDSDADLAMLLTASERFAKAVAAN